jgi:hypothetical protein
MDFADDSYYQPGMHLGLPASAPLGATNLWTRDIQIRKQFEGVSHTHQPDVYTLPRDHTVEQQSMLTPCEDLEFLNGKFQRDVCAVLRVPEEMVRSKSGGATQENTRKTMAMGRVFSSNMAEVCRCLQELLACVYKRIYKKDNVEFILLPMPRLEVDSLADMKVLFEIGALTPDMSLQLSHIMLGEDIENKKRRVELERGGVATRPRQQQKLSGPNAADKEKDEPSLAGDEDELPRKKKKDGDKRPSGD